MAHLHVIEDDPAIRASVIRALSELGHAVTSSPSESSTITVGELVIDPSTRQATMRGEALDLTRREFDLLHLLASRPGEVITKREILAEVWRQVYGGGERTVDVHLSWLRRKLGETASAPVYLHSYRGVGIKLAPPSD